MTYSPAEQEKRIHFLGANVDLCDLRSIYRLACTLRGEGNGLSCPAKEDGTGALEGINIPRLDVLYLNAGIGGWIGIPWIPAIWGCITGLPESITYWKWLIFPERGATVKPQASYLNGGRVEKVQEKPKQEERIERLERVSSIPSGRMSEDEPPLGEVFCANVFGHYLLTHELMPLLSTSRGGRVEGERGRIIWISTLEPQPTDLPMNDLQGLTSKNPYYGSKRLTDLLGLTAKLPAVRSINSDFFHLKNYALPHNPIFSTTSKLEDEQEIAEVEDKQQRPEMYVAQPGVVNTNISGINMFASMFMLIGFYLARWMGQVWFPIKAYPGAVAPVWLGLADQSLLDNLETCPDTPPVSRDGSGEEGSVSSHGDHYDGGITSDIVQAKCKWGSSTDRCGNERVRKTEVPGWGWSGRVGEKIDKAGRGSHAVDLTREAREDFEGDGRYAWTYMEGLRRGWEQRLQVGDAMRKTERRRSDDR